MAGFDEENKAREDYLLKCLDSARSFLSKYLSEVRDAREAADNVWQVLREMEPLRPLTVAYYLFDDCRDEVQPRIASQLRYLQDQGHQVFILFRGDAPLWVRDAVSPQDLIEVAPESGIEAVLPDVDVLVGTSWKTAWDVMLCRRAEPILLETEADTFKLFSDPTAFGYVMELPVPVACVSEPVRNALTLYGRSPALAVTDEEVERVISLAARMHRSAQATTVQ